MIATTQRAPYASDPATSLGRLHAEAPSAMRTAYARDRDRIIHCTPFRRLKGKTQVFIAHEGDHLVLVLNPDHPFYREIYQPLSEGEAIPDQQLRSKLELLLLAAARSEAVARDGNPSLIQHRLEWSNTLAAFLNDK